jgi:hypothetical protein
MTFQQLIDKAGNVSRGTRFNGVVYCDKDGKPDETRRFLTWEDWVEFHDKQDSQREEVLPRAIGKFVREQVAPLRERIEQLEQTLGEFGYRGVWQEGIVYRAGNFVTLGGSLWHCNVEQTTLRPTTDNSDWSLAVKRGRDGKAEPRRPPTAPRTMSVG